MVITITVIVALLSLDLYMNEESTQGQRILLTRITTAR